jgi:hypothetical protein
LERNIFFCLLVGEMPRVQEIHGAVFQRTLSSPSMSVHQIGMLPNLMMTPVKGLFTVFRMSMVCTNSAYLLLFGAVYMRVFMLQMLYAG